MTDFEFKKVLEEIPGVIYVREMTGIKPGEVWNPLKDVVAECAKAGYDVNKSGTPLMMLDYNAETGTSFVKYCQPFISVDGEYAKAIISACHNNDTERDHDEADGILLDLLTTLGFTKTVEAYNAVDKYYA